MRKPWLVPRLLLHGDAVHYYNLAGHVTTMPQPYRNHAGHAKARPYVIEDSLTTRECCRVDEMLMICGMSISNRHTCMPMARVIRISSW